MQVSMTREEAILLSAYTGFLLAPDFSEVHKFCEDTLGRPIWTHEFADSCVQKEIQEKLRPQIMELVQNIVALRPVSREQVERMRGEWVKPHWRNSTSCAICSQCGFEAHHHEYHGVQDTYLFCPRCMAPMTDEAVEMVMERLETIR